MENRLPSAQAVEAEIFSLLSRRREGATICPSEVSRALVADNNAWREAMPLVREVALKLQQQGLIEATRGGTPVPATAPGGPIRLALVKSRKS